MKKILFFFIFFLFMWNTFWYNISEKNEKILLDLHQKALYQYEKNPKKAYDILEKIEKKDYKNNHPLVIYVYSYIKSFTLDFIAQYEEIQQEEENKENNTKSEEQDTQDEQTFWERVLSQREWLTLFEEKGFTHISNFSLEPRYDHIFIKTFRFENTGTLKDLEILQDITLVNAENKIVGKWYVKWDIIEIVLDDFIVKKDEVYTLNLFANIYPSKNKDQVWELIIKFLEVWWLEAYSYSNGTQITSQPTIDDPKTVLISRSNQFVLGLDFSPSYTQGAWFVFQNNSWYTLNLLQFDFQIVGGFLQDLDDETEFILKRKWYSKEYGRAKKWDILWNILTIYPNGEDYDFISWDVQHEYILEIQHIWNPDGLREIRLKNIVIQDDLWTIISNLDQYHNTWFTDIVFTFRY